MHYRKNPDEMTPNERAKALSQGKDVDRIPLFPFMNEPASLYFDVTVREYSQDPKALAKVEINSYRAFYHDGIGGGPGLFGIPEAMGTVLGFPENDNPYVKDPVLKDLKDIGKLEPANPYKDGRLPMILEAIKIMQDEVGHEVGIGGDIGGPFTAAAALRGVEVFLRDIRKNPEEVHKLLELTTESALRFIDAVCELGAEPSITEPLGSCSLISAKQFRTFVKPYLKKYMDRIKGKWGLEPTLHMCGNTEPILEDMVETGAPAISLDNVVDMELAKNRIGDKVTLAGNVKPVESMRFGTKEDIYEDVKTCLEKCYDNPNGYVLATGCQVPVFTPMENIYHFMEAGRKYGKYPLDPKNWR